MLYQANAVVELRRPRLAPQRDLGDAVIEGVQHALAHLRIAPEQIRRGRQGLRTGTGVDRRQGLLEIHGLGPKDLQWPIVGEVSEQDGDVPAGHRTVEEPAAGEAHHVDHACGDDVEPVPHVVVSDVWVGAKSRASVSAYCLNTAVSGIEGSSNHRVSIPCTKARISTALTAGSMSMRYEPSA